MKKLYSFFALLLTSLMVGAQTFTVTNTPLTWVENGLVLGCSQPIVAAKTSGNFIEALEQANLGRIKQIVFDPSVSVVDFTGRWQQTTQLCANGVSIIGPSNRVVTIIGALGASYKTLTITGKNDTISNLTFQNAYIELNGISSVISNNKFNTNQEIGSVFIFNSKYNLIQENIFSSIVTTGGNSAIRIGTNQAENVVGNCVGDKIIDNTVSGFWNGLQAGQWKQANPKCDSLLVRQNKFYGNRNAGAYIINSVGTLIDSNYIYGNNGGGLFVEDCKFTNVYANNVGFDKLNNINGNKGNGINVNGGSNIKVGDFVKGPNIVVGSGNNLAELGKNNGISFDVSPINGKIATNSSIKANFVGVKSDGTGDINTGTKQCGIYFGEMSNNSLVLNDTIGGLTIDEANTVGFNGQIGGAINSGIQINQNCNTVLIYGNYVGITKAGLAVPNAWDGIGLKGVTKCDVYKNIVGNNTQGISLRWASYDSPIQTTYTNVRGNFVGTSNGIDLQPNIYDPKVKDSNGKPIIPDNCGISIEWGSNNNTVGGLTAGDSNFVMNEAKGIWVAGNNASSNNNNIIGNSIKNCITSGISVENSTKNLTIKNNYVTNTTDGNALRISGTVTNLSARSNQFINSKYIGAGLQPTKGNGIYMTSGNTSIIGGTGVDEGNIITNNQTDGISLSGVATNNVMLRRNKIACNQGTGINLNGNANTNYMFDIIRVDTSASDVNSITGLLKGITIKDVIVEVFGPGATCKQSCNTDIGRQGYEYLGTTTTDAAGKWTLTLASPILLSDVTQITATATTPSALNVAGSFVTSEFSRCNDALPVEFISFTAKSVQNGVALNWITATETNNDYFLIERSTDGINFTAIGSPVNGAGTSNQTHVYKYLDSDPNEGINYYRIRQVDYDGKFDFSNVQVVNLTGAQMISVSPNPNNGHFGIKIISESSELFNISIYNALGQSIYTTSFNVYGGYAEHKVNLDKFASGVYTLVIKNDVDTWTEKVIKE